MKRLTVIAVVAALFSNGANADEHATSPSVAEHGVAGPAVDSHTATAHEEGGEHHWSLADVFVPASVKQTAKEQLGQSVIGHEAVNDISHVAFAVLILALLAILLVFAVLRRRARGNDDVLPEEKFNPLAVFQFFSDALLGLMEGLLGREKALYFLPLIGSLGVFILFSNLLGLIPGFLPPTGNLNTTFALGSIVFLATHYYGVRSHGISYFKHFFGPIIKWYALPLMLLMFAIEMISHIARPVSLGIRLFGNMFGDHAALGAFLAMAAVAVVGPSVIAKIAVLMPLIPMVLGIFVAVVQTLVFCILSTVYIYIATEEEDGHEEAHA